MIYMYGKLGPRWLNELGTVVGLPNNAYKLITNTAWVRARFCKLQKGCTRPAAASDKFYQLIVHGRWFSPGTPASFTTNTGRHDIAEILLKVALSTNKSINVDYDCIWLLKKWFLCTNLHIYMCIIAGVIGRELLSL